MVTRLAEFLGLANIVLGLATMLQPHQQVIGIASIAMGVAVLVVIHHSFNF